MSQWKSPPPVVVLSGEHEYLRIREVKEAVRVAEANGRTIEFLQGTDREELRNILSSTGVFFQEEVLVVVENPEKIDADLVIRHHDSEDATTVLVLHQVGPVKAKTNLMKVVKALPARFVAEFEQPKPWEAVDHAADFCVVEARRYKIKLDQPLATAIVQNIGTSLGILAFEIQKLGMLLAASGETNVTAAHVKSTIASFSELGPSPIIEALEHRDLQATARALANMRRTHAGNLGAATMLACSWIGRSLSKWLHVAALNEEGFSLGEISSRTGEHEFKVRKIYLPVVRRWGKGRLTSLLKSIAGVERSVKSGHVHPWIVLECALFRSFQGGSSG